VGDLDIPVQKKRVKKTGTGGEPIERRRARKKMATNGKVPPKGPVVPSKY